MEFNIEHKKILFVHIPKTGGTSVIDLLEKSSNFIGSNEKSTNYRHSKNYDKELRQCKQIHKTILDFNYDKNPIYFSFAIVRNPYDRIISEYTWSGNDKMMSFDKFLKHVELNIDHSHYKPQYKYVCDYNGGKILVDQIYKLEEINKFYYEIIQLIPQLKKYKLEKLNESKESEEKIKVTKNELDIINKLYKYDFFMFRYEMIIL